MWIEFQSARLSKRGFSPGVAYVSAMRNPSNEVKMNFTKRRIEILSLLLLFIVAVMLIFPVSAETADSDNVPIFTIPGKTTIYDMKMITERSESSIDYDSLKIPESVIASSDAKKASGEIAKDSEIYDIVCFDNLIPNRSDNVEIPITLYGKEYIINLKRIDFGDMDDGIDSYEGIIQDINDSHAVWTVDRNNIFCGFISYPGEYIIISPIQDSKYSKTSGKPLHVVYSEYDMLQPTEPVAFCGTSTQTTITNQISTSVQNYLNQNTRDTSSIVYIDLLVVTDNGFYSSDWITLAQQYFATANQNNCYGRDDIKIHFDAQFDSSKRSLLSNHPYHTIDPLYVVHAYYPDTLLNSLDADICLYLGGYDLPSSRVVGAAGIVGSVSNSDSSVIYTGRHAWVQMVGQDLISNGGDYFRTHSIIHELGHLLGADHPYAYTWRNIFNIEQRTVMHDNYLGSIVSKLEFSSANYDGDNIHNNAMYLRQNKVAVSSYA